MNTRTRLAQKGSVLIVVLGVLVILALLATTFATLQQLDRTISRNYVDDVRAKLAAQSGVEYAISQIKEMMSQGFFSTSGGPQAHVYWGNDLSESGTDPSLQQVAIERAKNPSWAYEDESPQNPNDPGVLPKMVNVKLPDGSISQVGFSGFHDTGTYTAYGDIYALRVVDSSGMIYVNDGLYQYKYKNDIGDGSGQHSSVTATLRRILNNLGKHPDVDIPNLGNKIVSKRADGYTSKYDLRRAVDYDETQFNKFKDFVTTHAWVDKNVVNPVPLSGKVFPSQYPVDYFRGGGAGGIRLRRGRGYNSSGNMLFSSEPLQWYKPGLTSPGYNAIYAHDELFPSYVEVVWRAPVNINTAPEPVLTSLIAGVSGFFSIERRRFSPYMGSPSSFTYSGGAFFNIPCTFTIPQKYYTWEYVQHAMSSSGTSGGDEIGNLYRTAEFVLPGSGTSTGVQAKTVSQHIIACRSKSVFNGVNYGNLPTLGGLFKSWSHFHNFLDYLVEKGVIKDSRVGVFYDYKPASVFNWSKIQGPSSAARKFASRAMADALKANFNPNVILNETNPDRNMYLRVDKTDLIVNSTEFCFTPMGYYEIESLGRVLRPSEGAGAGGTTGGVTALTSAGNEIVAEKKILVSVKLYDAYRETSQRHFYAAEMDGSPQTGLKPRQSDPETNNNLSLEIGPEIDNGPLIYGDTFAGANFQYDSVWDGYAGYPSGQSTIQTGWGYEYGGYISLPTIGGVKWNMNDFKQPGTLEQTPQGGAQFGSVIHSHFSWDFKAHHHASSSALGNDWFRDELGSNYRYANSYIDQIPYSKPPKVERAMNHEDRLENAFSPYCPTYGMRYRLARSFRMPMTSPSGGGSTSGLPSSLNSMKAFAPSDLRIDGAYSERHSGIAYWMDQGVSWNEKGGTMAVWLKPSFYPEHSGKQRKIFGMSRWHAKNYGHRNPGLWDVFYFPAHDKLPDITSQTESMSTNYIGSPYSTCSDQPVEYTGGKGVWPFKPMSFVSGWAASCYDGALADMYDEGPWLEEENYCATPTLNHRLHPGESSKPNYLDKGRWTHLIFRWHTDVGSYVKTQNHWQSLYVNGQFLSGTKQLYAGTIFDSSYRTRWFTIQSFSDGSTNKWRTNTIRLGEVSSHGFGTFNRNFSADMTFDEFYVWKSNGTTQLNNAKQIWLRGRYYKPQWGNYSDAGFVSRSIDLDKVSPARYLPPPSSTANPPMNTGGTTGGSSTVPAPVAPKRRLLGVSWTWFAEDYIKNVPLQWDYSNASSPTKLWQTDNGQYNGTPVPCVRMFVMADGNTFPANQQGFKADGFSQILGSDGKPYEVTDASDIRYRVMFQIKGINSGSILLGTPYFEDVTIFYDQGDVEFLLYAVVNTT